MCGESDQHPPSVGAGAGPGPDRGVGAGEDAPCQHSTLPGRLRTQRSPQHRHGVCGRW